MNSHSSQKCNLSAPETALQTMYFLRSFKNRTKNFKKKLVIMFILMEYISFTNVSFFLHATSFIIGENSQVMHGWRKIVLMKPHLYFFPRNISDYLFVEKILLEFFLCNIFPKPLNINENSQPRKTGDCPLGKFIYL